MAKRGCLSRIFITIILLGILATATLWGIGYMEYKSAINDTPLTAKIAAIQESPTYVTTDNISNYFLTDIVIVEDKRFYDHGAVDPMGLARAVMNNIKTGDFSEGGSTITQQVAKNLYFSNEKRLTRKVAELYVAKDLEKTYSKEEILEFYSNIIFFGQNCYGIQPASNTYFAKEPMELTFEEAAVLAGIPQAPSRYNPISNPESSQNRTEAVLNILTENNITP